MEFVAELLHQRAQLLRPQRLVLAHHDHEVASEGGHAHAHLIASQHLTRTLRKAFGEYVANGVNVPDGRVVVEVSCWSEALGERDDSQAAGGAQRHRDADVEEEVATQIQ